MIFFSVISAHPPFFQSYSSKPAGMGLTRIATTPRTQFPALWSLAPL